MFEELRELLEEQGKVFGEFKAANGAEIKELQAQILELAKKAGRPPAPGGGYTLSAEQRDHLVDFMRTGNTDSLVKARETKTGTTGSDPSGGYLVPQQVDSQIDTIRQQSTPMRRICRVLKPETPEYKKLVSLGGTSSGWVGETETRPETDTSKLAVLSPAWGGLYANPAASQDMLDDSAFDVAEWFRSEVAREFSDQEGESFITGNGVKKPRGILTFPTSTARDKTRDFGTIQYVATKVAAGLGSLDAFIDMVHALKPKYRQNARWSANSLTLAEMRKYKDGDGRLYWQESIVAGQPSIFMGYPVEEDDFMPDIAEGAYPIMLGDFQAAYWIFDRPTMILRDPYTNKPYVHFYTATRVGSMLAQSEAVKLLKVASN